METTKPKNFSFLYALFTNGKESFAIMVAMELTKEDFSYEKAIKFHHHRKQAPAPDAE